MPALVLAGSCAWAQDEPQAEIETELAPVTVSAHGGQAVPYSDTGVSVTVLNPAELRDTQQLYNVSDALTTQVPGVYVMPGGGINQRGNISYLVVRGMKNDAYTQLMLDGMRLNSGSGNGLVTSNVLARANTFDLGTLELLRGAEAATYGGGSMAGVLYMQTPKGAGKPSLTLFNEGGSHDSYIGNLTAQGEVGKLAYFLSATYEHTNNDMETLGNGDVQLKHAGRYANRTEALRLDYALNESADVTLTYRREDADYGARASDWSTYPPTAVVSPYVFISNLLTAKVATKVNTRYSTSLMAGYYGSDSSMPSPGYPYTQNLRNVQVEWRNAYRWNEHHRSTGGLAWNRSLYTADSGSGTRNNSRSLENVYALFAEHVYSPRKGWENSLALRWDQSSVFSGLPTARAASSYRFNRERSRLFGSIGKGYLAPTSFQRSGNTYNYYGALYHGNPDLDVEQNLTVDAGFEQEYLRDHRASVTLFWARLEDHIGTENRADGYHYINERGHSTAQGVELALRGTWERAWNTGYTLSYTLTQPKSDDRQLADTARQVWTGDLHTSPTERFTTGVGLSAAVGRTDYSGKRQDSYYILRWYAHYTVSEHLKLHLRVENLTNQRFVAEPSWVSDADSLLNAGTSVHAGCTLSF
ncbi:MAG: TonB-dependent receptor plug domain-containing protein [Akkermansia sp.]